MKVDLHELNSWPLLASNRSKMLALLGDYRNWSIFQYMSRYPVPNFWFGTDLERNPLILCCIFCSKLFQTTLWANIMDILVNLDLKIKTVQSPIPFLMLSHKISISAMRSAMKAKTHQVARSISSKSSCFLCLIKYWQNSCAVTCLEKPCIFPIDLHGIKWWNSGISRAFSCQLELPMRHSLHFTTLQSPGWHSLERRKGPISGHCPLVCSCTFGILLICACFLA
jgi:hypothetical protein